MKKRFNIASIISIVIGLYLVYVGSEYFKTGSIWDLVELIIGGLILSFRGYQLITGKEI